MQDQEYDQQQEGKKYAVGFKLYSSWMKELFPQREITYYDYAKPMYEKAQSRRQRFMWIKKVIELCPQNSIAYYQLGLLYQQGKKQKEAIESYKKCLTLNPLNSLAYFRLGTISECNRKILEAVIYYKKALSVKSNTKEEQLFQKPRYQSIAENAQECLKLAAYELRFEQALVLYKADKQNSLPTLRSLFSYYLYVGQKMAQMEFYKEALFYYEKLLKLYDHPQIWQQILRYKNTK